MILAITDGVGLTDQLSPGDRNNQVSILSDFFQAQFEAFDARACCGAWSVVKTTGDGLIFLATENGCTAGCESDKLCHNFLLAIKAVTKACRARDIFIRSVIHHCKHGSAIQGSELN